MRELYPEIAHVKKYSLKVSDLHTLYVEECGNPKGIPALFLHGGPGAGLSPNHRRFFNPEKYRIILFDQRGAGKSKPYAELRENTIWDLISDIEAIRAKLKVSKWLVFGGSWGSTLALAYAISHPERVLHLIVRGIFLCRHEEILWFYQYGAHQIFPDFWKDYVKVIPENERHDMLVERSTAASLRPTKKCASKPRAPGASGRARPSVLSPARPCTTSSAKSPSRSRASNAITSCTTAFFPKTTTC
jgi:proline iminopeptidase